MKHLKKLAAAALAAAALMAFAGAGSASATTLEVGGVKQNGKVAIVATLQAATTTLLRDNFGFTINTCTGSEVGGLTKSSFSATIVTADLVTLSFSKCTNEPVVVHAGGLLHIEYTSGTNGTVTWSGSEFTTDGPFGILSCKTGTGTHLGTLAGVASGHATMHIDARLNCSGISSRWTATYTVTSPTGLGVSA